MADDVRGERRVALWLVLVALVALVLEAASLVGLRVVEGGWVAPWTVAAERRSVGTPGPTAAAEEGSREVPYRLAWRLGELREVLHPYVGFVAEAPAGDVHGEHDPLRRLGFAYDHSPIPHPARSRDFVVLVCGGSVAQGLEELGGAEALVERLRALPGAEGKRIHVGSVALGGFKQPQQLLAVAYLLSLGFRFDLVVNLDGFNEATLGLSENIPNGVASFFPRLWSLRVQDVPDRRRQAMMGETLVLRERRSRWARAFERPGLAASATASLLWKLGDARLARRIAELERAVVEAAPGDRSWAIAPPHPGRAGADKRIEEAVSVWRASSLQLARLVEANGARYVHLLQPNQYVPDAKPMRASERRVALVEPSPPARWVPQVYPRLVVAGGELREAGVAFHDLTRVFADVEEPLYVDNCCHFNERGYRILGAAVADAVASALEEVPAGPAPALSTDPPGRAPGRSSAARPASARPGGAPRPGPS